MIDDFLAFELNDTSRAKPIPCPNCQAKLKRKIVMSETSVNVGRPYIVCKECSEQGHISFWFCDKGECDLCGSPLFQAAAKKGKHAGRKFEACSHGCPGKFRWLE